MSVVKAGLNQVFICVCCAKAFRDSEAKEPVAVEMTNCIIQVQKVQPHPKYPEDLDLATITWEDKAGQVVKIPEATADECCAAHVQLCDSRLLRFRQEPDGRQHIVGAARLEVTL